MAEQETILKFAEGLKQSLAKLDGPLSANIFFPGSQGYINSTSSYFWSSSKQNPTLVYQPRSPIDVMAFIQQLVESGIHIPFAVKAASHIAPLGFNSTGKGILVDMVLFKDIQYNQDASTLDVGPGSTWEEVQNYFDQNDIQQNVVGATSCAGVGVAGFLLGGGYGNKANQLGLAMDNIVSIEVVTANGDPLKASATENPDLFWALMGGGNNFGIVTKWTIKTHFQDPQVYFFRHTYPEETFPLVQKAVLAFSKKVDDNRKANVETKFEWTVSTDGKLSAFAVAECFYDGVAPTDLFKEFDDIPRLYNKSQSHTSFGELMKNLIGRRQTYRWGIVEGVNDLPKDFRGRYTHVMLSGFNEKLIQKVVDVARNAAPYLLKHSGLQLYPDLWPASKHIFDNSPDAAWPHKKGEPNFPLPIRCLWTDPKDDEFWLGKLNEMANEIWAFAISQGCSKADTPLYYNLALDKTAVEEIYRENLSRLSEYRKKYDKTRLMNSTGGFRVPE